MSTVDQYADRLSATLAGQKPPAPKAEKVWRPPTRAQLAYGNVIAFDQSLAACGMVILTHQGEMLRVLDAVTFKTESGAHTGHEGQFRRGIELARQVRAYFVQHHHTPAEWAVVHEAPPVGGGQIRTPESSLLAAQVLRIEMDYGDFTVVPMMSPQQHKWITTGDRNIRKAPHRAALLRLADVLGLEDYDRVTNEAQRDALSVGLSHLVRTAAADASR